MKVKLRFFTFFFVWEFFLSAMYSTTVSFISLALVLFSRFLFSVFKSDCKLISFKISLFIYDYETNLIAKFNLYFENSIGLTEYSCVQCTFYKVGTIYFVSFSLVFVKICYFVTMKCHATKISLGLSFLEIVCVWSALRIIDSLIDTNFAMVSV